jgi:hypothetical protein
MPRTPSWLEVVAEYSAVPADRLRYHERAGVALLGELNRGVIFFLAPWRALSRLALKWLTEALAAADPVGRLAVAVVDARGASKKLWPQSREADLVARFPRMAGRKSPLQYGEALWIRDGAVIALTCDESDQKELRSRIRALLREGRAEQAAAPGRPRD